MGPLSYMWYVIKWRMTLQEVLSAFLGPVWMAQYISLLLQFDDYTIQPVANRFINYAIPAHTTTTATATATTTTVT